MDDQAAVLVVVPRQAAGRVTGVCFPERLGPFSGPPFPGQCLHVVGSAVASHGEQDLFVIRGGDARQGAHLGEAEFAGLEMPSDFGQIGEGASDPDLLPGRVEADTATPVQPVGAAHEPRLFPSAQVVEFLQQNEESGGGGIDAAMQGDELLVEFREAMNTVVGTGRRSDMDWGHGGASSVRVYTYSSMQK